MGEPDVWLFRHGQTEWSADGRHTGRTDIELTAAGEEEARALGPFVQRSDFDLVLCSPLKRAVRTAQLAGLGKFEVDPDLQEWDYGEFDGMRRSEIQEKVPGWTIWTGPWPGGETAADVAARADRLIARLRTVGASRIALVGHGHFSRVTAARWVGAEVPAGQWFDFDTASWSQLGWDRSVPVLVHWNVPAGGR